MAATLRDKQTTTSTVGSNFPHESGLTGIGQTITPSESYRCDQIKFYQSKYKLNPGTCYVSIEETTAGLPNGSKITDNAAFTCNDVKTLETVTFATQPVLESGVMYAIVFENPSGVIGTAPWYDDGKRLQIYGYTTHGNLYTDGTWLNKNGAWATYANGDIYFAMWGSPGYPGKPTTPGPAADASDVTLNDTTATWVSGGDTNSYNVYYGTLSGFLSLVESEVTDLYLPLVDGAFSVYNTITYWRVDAVNDQGTTTGDEWAFTTLRFYPVLPTGMSLDDDGNPTGTPSGLNNMISVHRLVAAAQDKIWYEEL